MKPVFPFISILALGLVASLVLYVLEQQKIGVRFGYFLTVIFLVINFASMLAFSISQKRESKESIFIVFIMIGVKLLLYLITIASLFAIDRTFTLSFVIYFFSLYLSFTILDLAIMLRKKS